MPSFELIPVFDDLDAAADHVKFNCRFAPVECVVAGKHWNVWGDGYAEPIEKEPANTQVQP